VESPYPSLKMSISEDAVEQFCRFSNRNERKLFSSDAQQSPYHLSNLLLVPGIHFCGFILAQIGYTMIRIRSIRRYLKSTVKKLINFFTVTCFITINFLEN
jgi:hypothetical protein